MKIAMANDHAGTDLKDQIKEWLESQGHEVVDFGTYDHESCDLSDFVLPATLAVAKGECDRGIFVDGVGYGSAMIANKVRGIFACAQRRERPLHRRQAHRPRPRHGRGQDLDDNRPAHCRQVRAPARQGGGDRREVHPTDRLSVPTFPNRDT